MKYFVDMSEKALEEVYKALPREVREGLSVKSYKREAAELLSYIQTYKFADDRALELTFESAQTSTGKVVAPLALRVVSCEAEDELLALKGSQGEVVLIAQ